ncbi:MAG: ATP-grasp domain-containing protein [Solobacterium sp.]|nr:ATP-grasp domain-containing protein [Solobacterium sp.]
MNPEIREVLKGKRILFIGASGHYELAVKKAQEYGAYAMCVNFNPNAAAKKYADLGADVDTYVPEEVLAFARENRADGIFTSWNEVNLYTAAYAAEKLGVPFYAKKEQLDALITKDAFKRTCRTYGVPYIHEFFVGNRLTEADIAAMEYPVIVKPTDSGGTRGMTVLYSRQGLEEAAEKALEVSIKKEFVVEPYLRNGQLLVMDFIVQNGKAVLCSAADRSLIRTSENEVPLSIAFMYPSKYIDVIKEQAVRPIQNLITGLGIENGIISFEAMVSEGKLYAIESQFRFGGTHFYTLLEEEYGIDLLGMMLAYAITGRFDYYSLDRVSPEFKTLYACQNLQAYGGKVKSISHREEMMKLPGVLWSVMIKTIGDTVPADGSTAINFAKIGITGDTERDLYRTMDRIQHTLVAEDEEGKNLIKQNIPPEYL